MPAARQRRARTHLGSVLLDDVFARFLVRAAVDGGEVDLVLGIGRAGILDELPMGRKRCIVHHERDRGIMEGILVKVEALVLRHQLVQLRVQEAREIGALEEALADNGHAKRDEAKERDVLAKVHGLGLHGLELIHDFFANCAHT